MRCSSVTWKRIVECPGNLREYLDELLTTHIITNDQYKDALPHR
jgi:hypothetical protein